VSPLISAYSDAPTHSQTVAAAHSSEQHAAELDHVLFTAPFVLINANNVGKLTAETIDEAWRLLAERPQLVTIAGTLVPGWWGIDIDPPPDIDPEAGEAAATDLAKWAADLGLPYLVRASGRPGGHHVIMRVPEELFHELYQVVRQSAHQHCGDSRVATIRRALRLLSAPHRLGLPCPVLENTVHLSDFPTTQQGEQPVTAPQSPGRRRERRSAKTTNDVDRSRVEFGDACARVRAGWSATQAWQAANQPGSKAREQGEANYRRWVWIKAATTVAAEHGLTEAQAWQQAQLASHTRSRELGHDQWRQLYWEPALIEAQTDRPRRLRTDTTAASNHHEIQGEAETVEINIIRAGLRAAAEQQPELQDRRPQFRRSMAAALDALAAALVRRDGSIDTRTWAEQARLDRKTLLRVRKAAIAYGILYLADTYAGGTTDCDKYGIGPTGQRFIDTTRETSPTRYTPLPRTYGTANAPRMHRRHCAERRTWSLRLALSTITDATKETYADCQHPIAKTLRSLHVQRQRWQSLTPDQQEARRQARRAVLRALSPSQRRDWFDWLAQRELIVAAATRTSLGTARQGDHDMLSHAPNTLHRGLLDPHWRDDTTPTTATEPAAQLQLMYAAAA
jgi:hypothetical protein